METVGGVTDDLEQLRSLPLTWLISRQNKTERTCL